VKLKKKFQCISAGAALLVGVGLTSEASAQTRAGWALNRYEPSPMGDAFFVAEHPWYSSTRTFSVGLFGDYAINPLRIVAINAGGTKEPSVDNITGMFVLHVGAQVSFLDRIGIHLSLPVSLSQSGFSSSANPTVAPADIRLGARVRLVGHSDRDAFSAHLGVNFWAPVGTATDNMGDGSIRVEPRLTLAGRGGPVRWSFTGGFMIRNEADVLNLAFGNELRFSGGIGLVLADERLMIGPEIYFFTPLRSYSAAQQAMFPGQGDSATFDQRSSGGELYFGASYLIADAFRVGLAGGPGFRQGPGVPEGRVLFNLSYAPVQRRTLPLIPIKTAYLIQTMCVQRHHKGAIQIRFVVVVR
jgi:OmpA-OmpF porin, OOP family